MINRLLIYCQQKFLIRKRKDDKKLKYDTITR